MPALRGTDKVAIQALKHTFSLSLSFILLQLTAY